MAEEKKTHEKPVVTKARKSPVSISAATFVAMKSLNIGWKGRLDSRGEGREMTFDQWDKEYEKLKRRIING